MGIVVGSCMPEIEFDQSSTENATNTHPPGRRRRYGKFNCDAFIIFGGSPFTFYCVRPGTNLWGDNLLSRKSFFFCVWNNLDLEMQEVSSSQQ